jgi:hypothetical protein
MQKTLKNLDVNVGSVIAGSEMEIKKTNQKEAAKKYYLINKDRYDKRIKKHFYLNLNKEEIKEYNKKQRLLNKKRYDKCKNKDNFLKKKKTPFSSKNYNKKYYLLNKKKLNKKNLKRTKQRLKTDIAFNLSLRLRSRLYLLLKGKYKKSKKTMELVGCTPEFLKQHIEKQFKPGMSWDKRHLFHIDHIKPCASFDLSKPEEQAKCFHYTNLQPLWAKDNLSKGAKYDG